MLALVEIGTLQATEPQEQADRLHIDLEHLSSRVVGNYTCAVEDTQSDGSYRSLDSTPNWVLKPSPQIWSTGHLVRK